MNREVDIQMRLDASSILEKFGEEIHLDFVITSIDVLNLSYDQFLIYIETKFLELEEELSKKNEEAIFNLVAQEISDDERKEAGHCNFQRKQKLERSKVDIEIKDQIYHN
jgi:hypothetical protein